MTRHFTPPSRRSGFTLVELLVVIGIIALLVSILLPALSRARQSAQTVKCLSNMRQIGQAQLMYAEAMQGNFPVHLEWTGGAAAPFNSTRPYLAIWDRQLAPYWTADEDLTATTPQLNSEILLCPRDNRPASEDGRFPRSYVVSMIPNVAADVALPDSGVVLGRTNWSRGKRGVKTSTVRKSSECIFLYENTFYGTNSTPSGTQNWQWEFLRGAEPGFMGVNDIPRLGPNGEFTHGRRTAFLFVDGHAAEHEPREAFQDGAGVSRGSQTWWHRG